MFLKKYARRLTFIVALLILWTAACGTASSDEGVLGLIAASQGNEPAAQDAQGEAGKQEFAQEGQETQQETPTPSPAPREEVEQRPTHMLIFVSLSGEVLLEEHPREGEPIVVPFFIPTRPGHNFLFWYEESEEPIAEFVFALGIDHDTVLWPFYEEIVEVPELAQPETGMPWSIGDEEPEDMVIETENGAVRSEKLGGMDIMIIDDPQDTAEWPGEETQPPKKAVEEAQLPEHYSIQVFSTHQECINEGDIIQVWAEVVGLEGLELSYQWQYFDGDWRNVPGATDIAHSFTATKESVNYRWRVAISLGSQAEEMLDS